MVGITSAGSFGNLGSKIAASDFVTCASYCGKPPARRTLRRYGSSSSPSSSGTYTQAARLGMRPGLQDLSLPSLRRYHPAPHGGTKMSEVTRCSAPRRDPRPNTGRHALLAGHQSQDHRRAPRLAPLPSNSEAGYAARPRPSLKLKIIEQFELQPGPVVARWSLCRVASINDDDLSATRLEESRARISRAC